MGKETRFVMFTGGTDAYGCTSKGQQGLMFIILKENNCFFKIRPGKHLTLRVGHHDL